MKRLSRAFCGTVALIAAVPDFGWAEEPEDIRRKADQHAVHSIRFWEARRPKVSIAHQTNAAPAELLEYIELDNRLSGFSQKPRPASLNKQEKTLWQEAIQAVPQKLLERAGNQFLGVYWVDDLGGSGYTDVVRTPEGRVAGVFVVFDRSALFSRGGNEWASWKESTPFQSGHVSVEVKIEGKKLSSKAHALRWIFLHEFGHVLALTEGHHPSWDQLAVNSYTGGGFPTLSWKVESDVSFRKTPASNAEWEAIRKNLVFYQKPKIENSQILNTYGALKRTAFPTLYAGTNYTDDFADAFALYVHTEVFKDPYHLRVHQNGQSLFEMGACWKEARCAEKRAYFEEMLKGVASSPSWP